MRGASARNLRLMETSLKSITDCMSSDRLSHGDGKAARPHYLSATYRQKNPVVFSKDKTSCRLFPHHPFGANCQAGEF